MGQIDGPNSMSLATNTTAANLTGNVDLRRQSIRHFSGMIKCNPQETERITDAVIIELKPRLAAKYIPGLPAYILFMCIRYIDFVDDEAHVAGFLSAVTKKIKKLPRVRIKSFILMKILIYFREMKILIIRFYGPQIRFDFFIHYSSIVAKKYVIE